MNSNLIDFDCVDEFLSPQEIQEINEFLWDDSTADRAEVPQNSTENMLDIQLSQPLPQNSPEHLKNAATRTATGLMTPVPSDDFGFFAFEFS